MRRIPDERREAHLRERRRQEAARARQRDAAKPTPAKIYKRDCNRCGRRYKGKGRLLCDQCLAYATNNYFPASGRYL